MLRLDQLPDGSQSKYHQCRVCEAQWTIKWDSVRSGKGDKILKQKPSAGRVEPLPQMPRWVWITLALMVGLILIRFGGASLLRVAILPLLVVFMGWLLYRLGRDQGWWHS